MWTMSLPSLHQKWYKDDVRLMCYRTERSGREYISSVHMDINGFSNKWYEQELDSSISAVSVMLRKSILCIKNVMCCLVFFLRKCESCYLFFSLELLRLKTLFKKSITSKGDQLKTSQLEWSRQKQSCGVSCSKREKHKDTHITFLWCVWELDREIVMAPAQDAVTLSAIEAGSFYVL